MKVLDLYDNKIPNIRKTLYTHYTSTLLKIQDTQDVNNEVIASTCKTSILLK